MGEGSNNEKNFLDFGPLGYSDISLDDIRLRSGSGLSGLGVSINAMQLERYYLKSCKTYVIGYNQNGVQIIKQDCIYSGIRDLSASVQGYLITKDLIGYIRPTISSVFDLNAFLVGKALERTDLKARIKGWSLETEYDLIGYINSLITSTSDLDVYLRPCLPGFKELSSSIRGWSRQNKEDLNAYLKYVDSAEETLHGYIRANFPGHSDLGLSIFKIWNSVHEDLSTNIHSWVIEYLNATVKFLGHLDLHANVKANYIKYLLANIAPVSPIDLKATLKGWGKKDLYAKIAYKRSPNDLSAIINSIDPLDLKATINGFLDISATKDLQAIISKLRWKDLSANVKLIQPLDLNAMINPVGGSSGLWAIIHPKVVYVRTILTLSYLEAKDLSATVNPLCFNSSYKDLSLNINVMHGSALNATVFGESGDNIRDLKAYLNTYDYYEQDFITVSAFNHPQYSTTLGLNIPSEIKYCELDSLELSMFGKGTRPELDLNASIIGNPFEKDLRAFVRAYSPMSHEPGGLREKLVTLKLNHNGYEEWRRYVEITFDQHVRSYYYFSGNQNVYREFINDQWVIQVDGFNLTNLPAGIEKSKLNRKYIFNLKNYASIDAAIRDMIDRVTAYREKDLTGEITVEERKEKDLNASIYTKIKYKTNRKLNAAIVSV